MSPALVLGPPEGPSGVAPESVLLGLPIVRRTALAARRAGFEEIGVIAPPLPVLAALVGTDAETLVEPPSDAVRIDWNRVVTVRDLEAIRGGAAPASVGVAVASPADFRRAEDHLLASLVKDTEGFMSRHVERKISLAVSRRLASTTITPNVMTLLSVAIGLFGATFFLESTAASQTAGALLFLLHSILDGCDGELARLKFQESRSGGLLDFWGDNVVHVAVFAAMAAGWSRSIGAAWPLALGALAVGGTLASAFLVYSRTMAAPREGPLYTSVATVAETRLSRAADALSRRDFIYLVLILSAFGKAAWFLVLTAVGAPVYFFVLTAIALAERRRPRSA